MSGNTNNVGVTVFLRTDDAKRLREQLQHLIDGWEIPDKERVVFEYDAEDVAAWGRFLRRLDLALNPAVLASTEAQEPPEGS